jgi:DNA primase
LKDGESKPPKYINSGETALFQKGHVLYNESHARSAAARGLPVVVCEGYADVIALWQAGFTGAVAPLGTALTEAQIASLWSMMPESDATGVREPILCFDGDGAGQRAATRAVDRILPQLQAGRSIRVAFLPDGMDPDDLIRAKGADAFQAVLNTAIPMVDMIWRTLTDGKQFATPESRAGLQKSIQDMCAPIADLAVKKQYESILKDKFYKAFRPQGKNTKSGGVAAQIVRLPDPKAAVKNARVRVALAAVLYFPEIFTQAEDLLGCLHIQDSRLDKLRQVMIEVLGDTPVMDHDLFIDIMNKKGFADDLQIVLNTGALHGASPKHGGNAGAALAGLREAVSSCH